MRTFEKVSSYLVTVDHRKTLEDMIADGHYDWADNDVNSRNFPFFRSAGTTEINLELYRVYRLVRGEKVRNYFQTNGLHAAGLAELLAFGVSYPDVQREFSVIALGSRWRNYRYFSYKTSSVPYLSGGDSSRFLNLISDDYYPFFEHVRFLAVRSSDPNV